MIFVLGIALFLLCLLIGRIASKSPHNMDRPGADQPLYGKIRRANGDFRVPDYIEAVCGVGLVVGFLMAVWSLAIGVSRVWPWLP